MNRKGQLGMFLIAFIGIIVGVTLFITVSQYVGDSTNAVEAGTASENLTVTIPAASTTVDVTGQDLLTTPVVYMQPNGSVIGSGNYTIDEGVSTATGLKSIQYESAAGVDAGLVGLTANITVDYGPDGYISDSAGRAIALLIPIFAALAIAVIALVPSLRSGVLDLMKR